MQTTHYKGILYFIIAVILITLGTQAYWFYKNYQSSKQALINDVQISLDNAVDQYYSTIAKDNTFQFFLNSDVVDDTLSYQKFKHKLRDPNDTILIAKTTRPPIIRTEFTFNSIGDDGKSQHITRFSTGDSIYIKDSYKNDSLVRDEIGKIKSRFHQAKGSDHDSLNILLNLDSLDVQPFKNLTSKILSAVLEDTLDLKRLHGLVKEELNRKRIGVDYAIAFKNILGDIQKYNPEISKQSILRTSSKSAYLPKNSILSLSFTNEKSTILKKNLLGILISMLLIGSVIGCLLYLLKVIQAQKQVVEIKNDLISNITHEFKTPIATIHTALEGIQSFNKTGDPEKTSKYLQLSSQQVDKLNTMVEKLLETATLDSSALVLQKEETNLVPLVQQIVAKYREMAPDKTFNFSTPSDNIWLTIDPFHFENAIDNVLDNAVKYGGDEIQVSFKKQSSTLLIAISDSGTDLTKTQATQLFEKFYRVPKGNTHDVKGFGIGLFYTKTIIEKHQGQIQVSTQPNTQFKMSIPYV